MTDKERVRRLFVICDPYESHDGPVGFTIQEADDIADDTEGTGLIVAEFETKALAHHALDAFIDVLFKNVDLKPEV